jgi:serine/threonine protein kinase
MLVEDHFQYLLADQVYYEPLSLYQPLESDYLEAVRRAVPDSWEISRRELWYDCQPPEANTPVQGWKIHLSATLANSTPVLVSAARVLCRAGVPFKFLSDKLMLSITNGKRWPRGSAGKFITAYPESTEQCGELLESLYEAMIGYKGPYILSDRRYRDCSVVYYRYGGISPIRRTDVNGAPVYIIKDADGQYVDDERSPYFHLPEGITDPFCSEEEEEADTGGEPTLKDGRYLIESALAFSNPGGVYLAKDRESGKEVIIKEARPFAYVTQQGTDAVWQLKKEHRLLTMLEDTGIAPRPVDFFRDWEHYYLVQELLQGTILRGHLAGISISLRTQLTHEYAKEFYDKYCKLFTRLAEVLQILHDREIVFSDLSHYNVMVLEDGEVLKLIDFEGAYERGVDVATLMFTPGFVPRQVMDEGSAKLEDDYFAFGGLMMSGLFPMNSVLGLDRNAHKRFLRAMRNDLSLPDEIAELISSLLDQDRTLRPRPSQVISVLQRDYEIKKPEVGTAEADEEELPKLLDRILDFIESTADSGREDRLFPADPTVYDTNPLSVAHGACGVALAFQRARGSVSQEIIDWIIKREIAPVTYSPGLYMGLSGIAWTLLELGYRKQAENVMGMTRDHHLLWRSPDLFYGAAGWGMAQLKFFLETGNEEYLAGARRAGKYILESRQEEEGKCWWETQEGICCGLAHGAAGISLFLLYLYLATGNEEGLQVGRKGLEFVVDKAIENLDGGITWRAWEGEPTYTPYWRWGSCGIGISLLRYWRALDEPHYKQLVDDILIDTDRKYTIFPSFFFGLAGIGDFYIDLAMLGEENERESALLGARKALAGLLLYRLEREGGLAFPGESLSRISCDFGTGSAGIAFFLHRYMTQDKPLFMLDELLQEKRAVAAGKGELAAAV